jgi:hypothetical protein
MVKGYGAPGLLVHPVHPTLVDICGRLKKFGKKLRHRKCMYLTCHGSSNLNLKHNMKGKHEKFAIHSDNAPN